MKLRAAPQVFINLPLPSHSLKISPPWQSRCRETTGHRTTAAAPELDSGIL